MSEDKYAENLGKLVTNFQSLEFSLRSFLVNAEIGSGASFPQSANLNTLIAGDLVPENAFTNYDSLGRLIEKYNNYPGVISGGLTIDATLVDVRDAIAHGRVSSPTPSSTLQLLKFAKPRDKKVKVTFSVSMTKEWFQQQISRTYESVRKVSDANEKLQSGKL